MSPLELACRYDKRTHHQRYICTRWEQICCHMQADTTCAELQSASWLSSASECVAAVPAAGATAAVAPAAGWRQARSSAFSKDVAAAQYSTSSASIPSTSRTYASRPAAHTACTCTPTTSARQSSSLGTDTEGARHLDLARPSLERRSAGRVDWWGEGSRSRAQEAEAAHHPTGACSGGPAEPAPP